MRHIVLAAALLAAPVPSLAQAQGQTGATPSQPGSVSPMTAPTVAAEYLAMAAAGDLYEKTSSQLMVETVSSGAEIKRFAREMVEDHNKTTMQLMTAAQRAGLAAPSAPAMTQQQQAMVEQLRAAQGAQRDQIYVQQQMMAHQQALALHQGYAQRGDNEALRAVAQEASKVVQEHIDDLHKIRSGT